MLLIILYSSPVSSVCVYVCAHNISLTRTRDAPPWLESCARAHCAYRRCAADCAHMMHFTCACLCVYVCMLHSDILYREVVCTLRYTVHTHERSRARRNRLCGIHAAPDALRRLHVCKWSFFFLAYSVCEWMCVLCIVYTHIYVCVS